MSRAAVILLICGFTLGPSRVIAATGSFDQAGISGLSDIALPPAAETQSKPAQPVRPVAPTVPALPIPPPPPVAPAPPVPPPPPAPPAPSIPPMPRRNIQLELTITDQTGGAVPDKKIVSMIAADGTWGRVRTAAMTRPPNFSRPVGVTLNVDARPSMVGVDNVQMELTIEYKPVTSLPSGGVQEEPTQLNQSLTVMLVNGRAMVVSQAADPVTDRKIVVEAKATVLK